MAQPQQPERQPQPEKKRGLRRKVLITCPSCGSRFQALRRRQAYQTSCVVCECPVRVAGADEKLSSPPEPAAPKPARRKKRQGQNVFHRAPRDPGRPRVKGPPLPFLSAFSFPWYPEVLLRWVYLSAGCSASVFLFVAVNWSMSQGGVFARAGYALGFPFGWLSIWTYSYLAALSTTIISETAAGADRVHGWPEPDWREWFVEMLRYVPAVLAAASVGYGVGLVSSLGFRFYWVPAIAAGFLLTPVFVLSAFDSGSPFVFSTPFIWKSLYRAPWGWLRFYTAAASLALVWPGTLILGYSMQPFYTALLTGPLMAATLLIYARLLGRLAFVIAE